MIPIVKRSQFEVSFLTHVNDEPLTVLKPLEQFVLAVDLGTELLGQEALQHRTNSVIVWLADDVASVVMSSIRAYADAGNEPFTLMVKVMAEAVVKDIFVFRHASLSALQHSIFTREVQDERVEVFDFRGANKQLTGAIKPPIARELSAKLLQIAFARMEHHIISNLQ